MAKKALKVFPTKIKNNTPIVDNSRNVNVVKSYCEKSEKLVEHLWNL